MSTYTYFEKTPNHHVCYLTSQKYLENRIRHLFRYPIAHLHNLDGYRIYLKSTNMLREHLDSLTVQLAETNLTLHLGSSGAFSSAV